MSIWLTLRASFPSAVEAGPKKARFIPNSAQISTPICCAWGGIQGEPERPEDLHRQVTGYARDVFPDLPLQFIRLGDLVDPGPASCEVISYLMEFEAQFSPRPVTLRGNHGQMTIDAAGSGERYPAGRRSWIMNGRQETLESYVGQPRPLMKRRRAWLGSLPTLHEAEAAGQVFVPAGVDPQRFPAFGETVHKWTRRREFPDPRCWTAPRPKCQRMVYGHTPKQVYLPEFAPDGGKLNTDTCAV
jgi:serine/threonine protein phosphatase 1